MARLYFDIKAKGEMNTEDVYLDRVAIRNNTKGILLNIEGVSHDMTYSDDENDKDLHLFSGRWKGLSFTATDIETGDDIIKDEENDEKLAEFLFSDDEEYDIEIESILLDFTGDDFDKEMYEGDIPKTDASLSIIIGDDKRLELEKEGVEIMDYCSPSLLEEIDR